jgi:hypothetical protein
MSEKFASDPAMMRLAGGMEYILWLTLIGKSRTTGWRWRQPGPKGREAYGTIGNAVANLQQVSEWPK